MGKQFPPDLREIEISIGSNVRASARNARALLKDIRECAELSMWCRWRRGGGEGGDAGGGPEPFLSGTGFKVSSDGNSFLVNGLS